MPQYTAEELALCLVARRTFPPQTRAPGIGAKFDSEIAKEARTLSGNMTKPMNDFLLPLYSGEGFLPGSTDVGDVSWQTPTAQALIAAWPAGVPGHSWQVVACGKTSLAHKAILCAGKTLATAATALIDDPALLQKAREEYARASRIRLRLPHRAGRRADRDLISQSISRTNGPPVLLSAGRFVFIHCQNPQYIHFYSCFPVHDS